MIEVHCDICGKEIGIVSDKRFILTALQCTGIELRANTVKTIYKSEDVCEECVYSINTYIGQLKRKLKGR